MSEVDKQLAQYLAELAVTNPQQLPLAFLELMKQRLVLTITNRLREAVEASFSEFKKQLKKELGGSNERN